jgi:predicted nucleic acid-binding protein
MIVYMDTSALVKYYVNETGTDQVAQLINEAELVGFASITYVEMASALSKAARMKWITEQDGRTAWEDFLSHWQAFARLTVNPALLERASRQAWEHGLRAYDAIHLASALEWRDSLAEPITLATYDKELWMAGQKMGLSVWPDELG